MKYRTDFVTNSSSSSFIIGKMDDESATINSVYQIIRDFYLDMLNRCNAVKSYIKDNPKLGIYFDDTSSKNYYEFKFKDNNFFSEKNKKVSQQIFRDFNFDIFNYIPTDLEWLKCENYEEYEKYWENRMKNKKEDEEYLHAPFTIADFLSDKPIRWLHYGSGSMDDKSHIVNSKSDVLNWYFDGAEQAFKYKNCEECGHRHCWNEKECKELRKRVEEEKIPEANACLYLLGRVCIYSECGYIPDDVVCALQDISEHSCNHMG